MNFNLDTSLANRLTNSSQIIRVMTEDWVSRHAFCPCCGNNSIVQYPNNRPVADFLCSNCNEDFELKSKKGGIGKKIVDGAYSTMIERLNSNSNPNFFMLSYNRATYSVRNFLCVPKHFFVPKFIEMRRPLSPTAKRAGWVGCNILLGHIPESGKVYFIRDGIKLSKSSVVDKWNQTIFLRQEQKLSSKGWSIDIISVIERIGKQEFTLADIYKYESELASLHPENHHIKDKIRQQLQLLRDKNYLTFINRGAYRLINDSI